LIKFISFIRSCYTCFNNYTPALSAVHFIYIRIKKTADGKMGRKKPRRNARGNKALDDDFRVNDLAKERKKERKREKLSRNVDQLETGVLRIYLLRCVMTCANCGTRRSSHYTRSHTIASRMRASFCLRAALKCGVNVEPFTLPFSFFFLLSYSRFTFRFRNVARLELRYNNLHSYRRFLD